MADAWSAEAQKTLRAMWASGRTMEAIAQTLTGAGIKPTTREAVAGYIRRNGLQKKERIDEHRHTA